MEPMIVALICTAVFGIVMTIAVFVRQLLLSRDKKLNDEAQSRALTQEASELEKIRVQMHNNERFRTHYVVLGENKAAIKYIETQIDEILAKKATVVERYIKLAVSESEKIINGEICLERKAICDELRKKADSELAFYDNEIMKLQEKRSKLWDVQIDHEDKLLSQEKSRNESLDSVYKQHSALLEKVYLRHIENTEIVATTSIKQNNFSFNDMLIIPFQYLMQFFSGGMLFVPNFTFVNQMKSEHTHRNRVAHVEDEINDVHNKPKNPSPKKKFTNSEEEDLVRRPTTMI